MTAGSDAEKEIEDWPKANMFKKKKPRAKLKRPQQFWMGMVTKEIQGLPSDTIFSRILSRFLSDNGLDIKSITQSKLIALSLSA